MDYHLKNSFCHIHPTKAHPSQYPPTLSSPMLSVAYVKFHMESQAKGKMTKLSGDN